MPRRLRVSRLQALSMEAASGAFAWAGFNADLSTARHLTATLNRGIFQWSGFNAVLTKQKALLTATRGLFAMTGQPATLTHAGLPAVTTAPVIVGTPTVGASSTYTAGTAIGFPAPTRTQQWALDSVDISGATTSSYIPITTDAGHTLTIRQIETNAFGVGTRTSAGVVIAAASTGPNWTSQVPTVSFTQGTSSSYSLIQHTTGFDPALHFFQTLTGTLPTGVTLNSASGLFYNGSSPVASASGLSYHIADLTVNDFTTRSAGAFFAENFNYANFAAATNHATNPKYYGSSDTSTMSLNSAGLSGKFLRIGYPANSSTSGYSFLYSFDNNNGVQVPFTGVAHDNFYFQIVLRMDQHVDFPFKTAGDEMASPKMFIIDHHDSSSNPGEVVCTNDHMRGFIQFYTGFTPSHGSQLICRSMNTPQGTPDFRNQPSVDAGTPASPTTMAQFRQRYGPWNSDRPNFPFSSVVGTSSLSTQGIPLTDSSLNGQPWTRNQWIVVTVFVNGAANLVKYWGSVYGQVPKLLGSTADINFSGALNMGRGSTGYPGFQLTPFITGNTNAAGSAQPTTWIDYAEIIASNSTIPHPGGFALP